MSAEEAEVDLHTHQQHVKARADLCDDAQCRKGRWRDQPGGDIWSQAPEQRRSQGDASEQLADDGWLAEPAQEPPERTPRHADRDQGQEQAGYTTLRPMSSGRKSSLAFSGASVTGVPMFQAGMGCLSAAYVVSSGAQTLSTRSVKRSPMSRSVTVPRCSGYFWMKLPKLRPS